MYLERLTEILLASDENTKWNDLDNSLHVVGIRDPNTEPNTLLVSISRYISSKNTI